MRSALFYISTLLLPVAAHAEPLTIDIHIVDDKGVGEKIGTVKAEDSAQGLVLTTDLHSLAPGEHGFHVHANPSCDAAEQDGKMVPGLAAGGHYDPDETGRHEGPNGTGHRGDLPALTVDAKGEAKATLVAPRLEAEELKGRSIMLHAGGDNYSDSPAPLGGGGARMACGVVR